MKDTTGYLLWRASWIGMLPVGPLTFGEAPTPKKNPTNAIALGSWFCIGLKKEVNSPNLKIF